MVFIGTTRLSGVLGSTSNTTATQVFTKHQQEHYTQVSKRHGIRLFDIKDGQNVVAVCFLSSILYYTIALSCKFLSGPRPSAVFPKDVPEKARLVQLRSTVPRRTIVLSTVVLQLPVRMLSERLGPM